MIARPAGASGTLLVGLISNGTAFTPQIALDGRRAASARRATQLAGADVDGDGRGDVVIMYNLGASGARFFRFVSDGACSAMRGRRTTRR